jgi:DNA-directed RNA polymerase beta' subunit
MSNQDPDETSKVCKNTRRKMISNTSADESITVTAEMAKSLDLKEGDVVSFNRQPTLRKSSLPTHRVTVADDNIDPVIIPVYFGHPTPAWTGDGDEMNIFLPSSIAVKDELDKISALKTSIGK